MNAWFTLIMGAMLAAVVGAVLTDTFIRMGHIIKEIIND